MVLVGAVSARMESIMCGIDGTTEAPLTNGESSSAAYACPVIALANTSRTTTFLWETWRA